MQANDTRLTKGGIVRFHTPMADENPEHRYILMDDPSIAEARAQKLREEGFPKMKAMVEIKLVCSLPFAPIQRVPLADLSLA